MLAIHNKKCQIGINVNSGRSTITGKILIRGKTSNFYKQKYYTIVKNKLVYDLPFFFRKTYFKKQKSFLHLISTFNNLEYNLPCRENIFIGKLNYVHITGRLYGIIDWFKFGDRIFFITYNNLKVATAFMSFALIIFKKNNNIFVLAPSGQLLFFNKFTQCSITPSKTPRVFNWLKPAKVLKLKGKKSIVRGIVKNPNDHPHGGRTRSVLKPMSPWNKNVIKKKT